MVNGLIIDQSSIPSKTCDVCIEAKQTHRPFPQEAQNRSEISGEHFMMDVWGPARVTSIGEWVYYISFCDDKIRYFTVVFLQNKREAARRIKEHVAMLKQKFGKAPTYMRVRKDQEVVRGSSFFCLSWHLNGFFSWLFGEHQMLLAQPELALQCTPGVELGVDQESHNSSLQAHCQ